MLAQTRLEGLEQRLTHDVVVRRKHAVRQMFLPEHLEHRHELSDVPQSGNRHTHRGHHSLRVRPELGRLVHVLDVAEGEELQRPGRDLEDGLEECHSIVLEVRLHHLPRILHLGVPHHLQLHAPPLLRLETGSPRVVEHAIARRERGVLSASLVAHFLPPVHVRVAVQVRGQVILPHRLLPLDEDLTLAGLVQKLHGGFQRRADEEVSAAAVPVHGSRGAPQVQRAQFSPRHPAVQPDGGHERSNRRHHLLARAPRFLQRILSLRLGRGEVVSGLEVAVAEEADECVPREFQDESAILDGEVHEHVEDGVQGLAELLDTLSTLGVETDLEAGEPGDVDDDGDARQGLALEGHGALRVVRELAEDETREEGTEQRRLLGGEIILLRLRVAEGWRVRDGWRGVVGVGWFRASDCRRFARKKYLGLDPSNRAPLSRGWWRGAPSACRWGPCRPASRRHFEPPVARRA